MKVMQRSANGAVVLVLGILSWVGLGCLTGIPAWIIGNQSLKAIDSGMADPSERGLVQAGRILGMVNCIVVVLAFAVWFIFVVLIIGLGAASSTQAR